MAYTTTSNVFAKLNISNSDFSATTVTTFIGWADAQIDSRTGKTWATASAQTDRFDSTELIYHKDVHSEGGALTASIPFQSKFNKLFLNKSPVTKISSVRLIIHNYEIANLFSYDSSASEYTDNTTEANSIRGTPFYAFASSVGTGDVLYIGSDYMFTSITTSLSTVGVGGVLTWEYYNGSDWTALSGVSEDTSDADDLNASGKISWTLPNDWQTTTVDTSSDIYFIRARVTTAHTTSPQVNHMYFGTNDVIYEELEGFDYQWDSVGRVILRNNYLPDEFDYVEVKYYAGASSTPSLVEQLSTVITGKMVMQALIAESFDETTSGTLGPYTWTKGEPYTNLREMVKQLEIEEEMLYRQIGVRANFFVT